MIKLTTPEKTWEHTDGDQEELFSVDGVVYTLPVHVPQRVALDAAERTSTMGGAAAEVWLMRKVLGDKAYAALKSAVDTREDMRAIAEVVRLRVFGDLENEGKG